MLGKRILSGIIGGLLAIGVIYEGNWLFFIAIILLTMWGWREYIRLVRHISVNVPILLGYGWLLLFLGSVWFSQIQCTILLGAILVYWSLLRPIFFHNKIKFVDSAYAFMGLVYIAFGFTAMLALRCSSLGIHLGLDQVPFGVDSTRVIMFLLIFSTWASDTCAFFVGKYWGTHKLCVAISPGKTKEGIIGGCIGTIVVAMIVAVVGQIPVIHGFLIGIIIAVMAPLGDLIESVLKRTCGVKDSGTLIPGHGGVLDRFDSLLVAAPMVLLYVYIVT